MRTKTGRNVIAYLICLVGLLAGTVASAQNFPVRSSVTVIGPSAYIEDYGRDNNLILSLVLVDNRAEYEGLLRISITGENYRLVTADGLFLQPITLRRGQPLILRGSQLADYFNINNLRVDGAGGQGILDNGGALPDGPITICAEFFDRNRFDEPAVSSGPCATRFVQQNYPPELVAPLGLIPALPTNVINFSWNPRHVPQPTNDEYELTVWEKAEGLTYDQIINSTGPVRDPIVTTIPRYTFTNYDAPLAVGQEYIWRVQVRDRRNAREFINAGISDFGEFTYGENPPDPPSRCPEVDRLLSTGTTAISTTIEWGFDPRTFVAQQQTARVGALGEAGSGGGGIQQPSNTTLTPTAYRLRYRLAGSTIWSAELEFSTNQRSHLLEGLEVGTDYEVELCTLCANGDEGCKTLPFTTLTLEEDCGEMPVPETLPLSNSSLQVSWNDVFQASGYRLRWRMTLGPDGRPVAAQTQQQTIRTDGNGESNAPPTPPGARAPSPNTNTHGAGTTESLVTGLEMNATYRFTFCKLCADGTEECYEWDQRFEGEAAVCDPAYVPTPTIMFGSETPTSLGVAWTFAGGANPAPGYELALISHPSGSPELADTLALGLNETSRTITELLAETSYDFTVCLTCLNGNLRCNTVTGTTTSYICPEQTELESGVTAVPIAPDGVRVEWSALAATADPAGWNVFVLSMAGDTLQRYPENGMSNPPGTTNHTFNGLTADTDYQIAICYNCDDQELPTCTLKTITVPGCEAVDLALTEEQVHFDFVEVSWEDVGTAPYSVTFWEQGGDPLAEPQEATETDFRLGGLSPLTTYDISVCFDCGATPVCDTITLTTIDVNCALAGDYEYDFECGLNVSLEDPENQQLVESLAPGDSIWAGDFLVQVGEITGNTTFGGYGTTAIPYLKGAKLRLDFFEVQVNEDCRMVSGKMVIKSPLEAALEQLQQGLQDLQDILGEIDNFLGTLSATLGTISTVLDQIATAADVTDEANAVLEDLVTALDQVPYLPDSYVDAVEDAADCLKQAALTGDDEAVRNCRDQLQEAIQNAQDYIDDLFDADFIVDFAPSVPAGVYWGLDSQRYDLITEGYDPRTIGGTPYKVPWASTSTDEPAGVPFGAVRRDGGSMSPVNFIGSDTEPFPGWTKDGTTAAHPGLYADGDQQTKVVFAAHDNPDAEEGNDSIPPVKLAGQLNVVTYAPVRHTVHIVPVNGVALTQDANAVETAVNAIFRPSVAEWTVVVEPALTVPEFEGQLSDIPESMLSNYTPEMNLLKSRVKAQGYYDGDHYYLIVVPSMQQPGRVGFMPRKRHFGFLSHAGLGNPDVFNRTVAHELAHGAFHLQHVYDRFDGLSPGSTDNLMDSGGGQTLFKYQWDNVHDPESNFTLFDDEEEGESVVEELAFEDELPDLTALSEGKTYVAPDGSLVYLPAGSIPQIVLCDNRYSTIPVGSLIRFQINNDVYESWYYHQGSGGSIISSKFTGYARYIIINGKKKRIVEQGYYENNASLVTSSEIWSREIFEYSANQTASYRDLKNCTLSVPTIVHVANSNGIPTLKDLVISSSNYGDAGIVTDVYCHPDPAGETQPTSLNICDIADQEGEFDQFEITQAVEALQAKIALRNAITAPHRTKGSYYHLVASGNSTSSVLLADEEKKFIEENLFLLKAKTGFNFYVLFHKTSDRYSEAQLNLFSTQVFEQSGLPSGSSKLIIVNYETFQDGLLSLATCGNMVEVPGASTDNNDGPEASGSLSDRIIAAFAKIPKPLYISKVLLLADNSFTEINYAKENFVGAPFINLLSIYKSGDYDTVDAKRKARPKRDDYEDEDGDVDDYAYCLAVKEWKIELEALLATARTNENIELQNFSSAYWEKLVKDKVELRHSYIDDRDIVLHYADYHFDNRVSEFVTNVGYQFGAYEITDDYLFKNIDWWSVIDPFVYTILDVASLVPIVGDVADAIGFVYAGVIRQDGLRTAGYSFGLIIGGGGLYNSVASSAKVYVAVGKYSDEGVEFVVRHIDDAIDETTELVRFSFLAKNADEAATYMNSVLGQNLHRWVPDDIYAVAGPAIREGVGGSVARAKSLVEEMGFFAPRLADAPSQYITKELVGYLDNITDDVLRRKILSQIDEVIPTGKLPQLLDELATPGFRTMADALEGPWVKSWSHIYRDGSAAALELSRNGKALQYFTSKADEMGAGAAGVADYIVTAANKPIKDIDVDSGDRLVVLLDRPGMTNEVILTGKNYAGTHKVNVLDRGYNPDLNNYGVALSQRGKITPDYVGSDHLHYLNEGVTIRIQMTGKRGTDFTAANNEMKAVHGDLWTGKPSDYTWHHLDDFDPETGMCTMQLVKSSAHGGEGVTGMAHSGSVAQYKAYYESANNAPGGFFYD